MSQKKWVSITGNAVWKDGTVITVSDLISFYFLLCFWVTDGFIISVSTSQTHLKFALIYSSLFQQAIASVVAAVENSHVSYLLFQTGSGFISCFPCLLITGSKLGPKLFPSNTVSKQRSQATLRVTASQHFLCKKRCISLLHHFKSQNEQLHMSHPLVKYYSDIMAPWIYAVPLISYCPCPMCTSQHDHCSRTTFTHRLCHFSTCASSGTVRQASQFIR